MSLKYDLLFVHLSVIIALCFHHKIKHLNIKLIFISFYVSSTVIKKSLLSYKLNFILLSRHINISKCTKLHIFAHFGPKIELFYELHTLERNKHTKMYLKNIYFMLCILQIHLNIYVLNKSTLQLYF